MSPRTTTSFVGGSTLRTPVASRRTPPPAAPLPRQTIASMTLEAMRERILHGVYPEGEPLRQDAIAEELGVSRIPIREALRQLEAEGLVTFAPHRGAVVSTLSLGEIEEVFTLRADIEAGLLRRALQRLGDRELQHASSILDAYDRALAAGAVGDWGELNWQFHSALYAPADRPVAMGIVQRLHQQADRYLRMQLALTHGESRAASEHRAILAAVERRDGRHAAQLLRRHITGAGRQLVQFLREQRSAEGTVSRKKQRT